MLSYKNDPTVKSRLRERFARHREMDELVQGETGSNGRGCFVWCSLDKYDHRAFETELGWPEWLARLADGIFEGLPKNECAQFGTDLIDAVPVGVDLDEVKYRIAVKRNDRLLDLLGPEVEGEHPCREDVRKAIRLVSAWAGNPDRTERDKGAARSAAYAAIAAAKMEAEAAEPAARSAADAAESAADAAESAAETEADAAVAAARSAADAAARLPPRLPPSRHARMAAWREEANALLAELKGLEGL